MIKILPRNPKLRKGQFQTSPKKSSVIKAKTKRRSSRVERHHVNLRLKKQIVRERPAFTVDIKPVGKKRFLKGYFYGKKVKKDSTLLAA